MSEDMKEIFKKMREEEEHRGMLLELGRLRQLLACAVCAVCGDELYDSEMALDEEQRLSHASCVTEET